jgi:hypothetical protein
MPGARRVRVLPGALAICRLPAKEPPPAWVFHAAASFLSITHTAEEWSVVCGADDPPPSVPAVERPWRALQLEGPIPFQEVGVLASLLEPLARAHVPVFAISTYDTDAVLVRESDLPRALDALRGEFEVDG